MTSVLADDFRTTPLWLDDAPLTPADGPLPPRVDVAVIGSGYCGLSAARVLARSGATVLVLDAGDPGAGASTRNHGHIGGGGKLPPKLEALVGADRAAIIQEDVIASVDFIRSLIREEALDVDYVQRGRFIAAHSPAAFDALQRRAETMRSGLALTVDIVPRARQHEEIGSGFYYGGITVAEAGALHPAKLHREMRRLAEAAGALIRGHARVETIAREPPGFTLQTARGTVRADQVVVATNAYSGSATPFIQRRIVPVTATMIATEPLPPALAHEILPRNRTGGDTKRALYAFRRSPRRKPPRLRRPRQVPRDRRTPRRHHPARLHAGRLATARRHPPQPLLERLRRLHLRLPAAHGRDRRLALRRRLPRRRRRDDELPRPPDRPQDPPSPEPPLRPRQRRLPHFAALPRPPLVPPRDRRLVSPPRPPRPHPRTRPAHLNHVSGHLANPAAPC